MSAWSLIYDGYEPRQQGLRETLCALGNGYFVSRGAAPDAVDDDIHYPGTYLAGGYNRLSTRVDDVDVENEDLVNLPNWLPLVLRIDGGHWLRPGTVDYLDYRQELDLRRGVLLRTLRFRDGQDRVTRWTERRFVSMRDQHVAGLDVTVTAENWSGVLTVHTGLDGSVINNGVARYRDLASRHLETLGTEQPADDVILIRSRFVQARLEVAVAARTRLYTDGDGSCGPRQIERRTEHPEDRVIQEIDLELGRRETVRVEKIAAVYTSSDMAASEAGLEAVEQVMRASRFNRLLALHTRAWERLWADCDIEIAVKHQDSTAMKLRLHIFHLLQTASLHSVNLDAGIPPRCWHGEAYRGHIMWDEMFIFPFLGLHLPAVARALLRYRDRRLPTARRLAAEAGFHGAMFPWQSGSNGREESQKIHLNPMSGRWIPDNTYRQRHIGAAIAWNVWQYYQITDDREYIYHHGAELILEISRFWASIATYNADMGRYEIKGVMGPDEFHTAYPGADPAKEGGVNNNAYTNVIVAWVLARALDVLSILPQDRRESLCEDLGIDEREIDRWDDISRGLRVPFHDDGIISQFDGYENLKEFDWESYKEKYGDLHRLDRILERENDHPKNYKISKQADVLMLFYLFSSDELELIFERLGYAFDHDLIPRNVDYYMHRTSHGSTLSWLVHAWVLARADRSRAWQLFCCALDSDFADIQGGTTPEGIHLGAMAGTVDILQRCFTGIETRGGVLHIDPYLPLELDGLETTIRYRNHTLHLTVNHERLEIESRPATAFPITIAYRGHFRDLTPGQACAFRLIKSCAATRDRAEDRGRDVEQLTEARG
ncbi:MAG: glycoside hydrolase family 65 protein [Rhodospirillales bacterium]|nr:MAG: glycoside hydrolase family 65 protein [Rhodospirillales bacterium]